MQILGRPGPALLDMDDVLAEFELGFLERWRHLYPQEFYCPLEHREGYHLDEDYPSHLHERVSAIYHAPGFFRTLKPVPGSQDAVAEMQALGIEIAVCTVPLLRAPHCWSEKYLWLYDHFGEWLARRMVVTKDKTFVRGSILIDDKPKVEGLLEPEWEHIIYDRPYNQSANGQRRLTWANWKEVLQL